LKLDEAGKRLKILVSEDQLSLAIGKRGQNARLTAKLTGWEVDIDAEHVVTKGFEEKIAEAVEHLAAIPGISREQADALVHAGLTRLEDLLSAEEGDLSSIPANRREGGGDFEGGARRGGAPHVESRRSCRAGGGQAAAGRCEPVEIYDADRNNFSSRDLSHEGQLPIPVGGGEKIYARSDIRHFEKARPREQGNSREGQGNGHCRRQSPRPARSIKSPPMARRRADQDHPERSPPGSRPSPRPNRPSPRPSRKKSSSSRAAAAAARTQARTGPVVETGSTATAPPPPVVEPPKPAAPAPPPPPPPPKPPVPQIGDKVGFIQLPTRPARAPAKKAEAPNAAVAPVRRVRTAANKIRAGNFNAWSRWPSGDAAAHASRPSPPRRRVPRSSLPDSAEVIIIKPPIIVRELAEQLKQKPFIIIGDLIKLGVFATVNQAIDEKIAQQLCAKYGFKFEVEKRAKGEGVVHAVEKKVELDVDDKPEDTQAARAGRHHHGPR
jgi:hypothetical protein